MKAMKRIFLIVLDSCGVGYEPDADKFGDVGADTLRRKESSFWEIARRTGRNSG